LLAIRLMKMYATDDQLALLDDVVRHDSEPRLRERARDALSQHGQTKKWNELIAGYLAIPDDDTRGWAIDMLIRRNDAAALQLLKDHLANEKSADFRARIQNALAKQKKP
jgi:HEAT repeat protein